MSEENKNLNTGEEANDNTNIEKENTENSVETYSYKFENMYDDSTEEVVEKPRRISLAAFLLSAVALVLAAVMTTWSVCYGMYGRGHTVPDIDYGPIAEENAVISDLELLAAIFETYSYFELDEEEMADAVLKAYVAATGDRYAEYFNAEEYEAFAASAVGSSEGIGINIIYTTITFDGIDYKVLKVTNVTRESPALKAGLKVGDLIIYVGIDKETRKSVHYLGYDEALSRLVGKSGTKAEFTVLRTADDGSYEEIPFSVTREAITSDSVLHHVCATDSSVGIVKILGFDYTTPTQFSQAVDELRAKGIEKFVFDVRYNGGGDLISIVAVLSYFLDEGQTIISTVDKSGRGSVRRAQVISSYDGDAAGCNVSREDIGKYKDLSVAVLCNSSTASAAELFTATFRDYKIGKVVGETTFGKGSMQSILSLEIFGMEGALKLTTNMYFPPCGESYEGIGIVPDVVIALDDALRNKNIYEFTDAEDNQLQAAIETLK